MAQQDDIYLRAVSSAIWADEAPARSPRAVSIEQAEARPVDSQWKKACVLIGSAILQLPMWGRAASVHAHYVSLYTHSHLQVSP